MKWCLICRDSTIISQWVKVICWKLQKYWKFQRWPWPFSMTLKLGHKNNPTNQLPIPKNIWNDVSFVEIGQLLTTGWAIFEYPVLPECGSQSPFEYQTSEIEKLEFPWNTKYFHMKVNDFCISCPPLKMPWSRFFKRRAANREQWLQSWVFLLYILI